jgi:hypothetical protein
MRLRKSDKERLYKKREPESFDDVTKRVLAQIERHRTDDEYKLKSFTFSELARELHILSGDAIKAYQELRSMGKLKSLETDGKRYWFKEQSIKWFEPSRDPDEIPEPTIKILTKGYRSISINSLAAQMYQIAESERVEVGVTIENELVIQLSDTGRFLLKKHNDGSYFINDPSIPLKASEHGFPVPSVAKAHFDEEDILWKALKSEARPLE